MSKINSINNLEDKTHYLTQALAKISHKGIELYCLTRIWHLLDDLDIEPVFQQYVSLNGERFFIDLYLPQIDLAIEINEGYHKRQENKDKIRNRNIVNITSGQLRKIDCSKSLEKIHIQINQLVSEIKVKIIEKKKRANFKPWVNKSVSFFKNKGFFSFLDNDFLHNVDDVYKTIGLKQKKRGFLPEKYGRQTTKDGYYLWFPKTKKTKKDNTWINEISDDSKYVYESNINKIGNNKQIKKVIKENHIRICFLETKDFLENKGYYFKGIYKLDIAKTKKMKKCVWKRISNKYQFKK